MTRRVVMVAAGVGQFGVRAATYRELIAEAGKACFDSLNGALKPSDIDGLILGSVMPERIRRFSGSGRTHWAAASSSMFPGPPTGTVRSPPRGNRAAG